MPDKLIPSYLLNISPFPFTLEDITMIEKRINYYLNEKFIITNLQKEISVGRKRYIFRYIWSESGLKDKAYNFSIDDRNLSTMQFNIEVNVHCDNESFYLDVYNIGIIKLEWNVPIKWKVASDKTKRSMERVMADIIWRSFKNEDYSKNLFHNPSKFIQGFSFESLDKSLINAIEKYKFESNLFVGRFKKLYEWENIYLLKEQVNSYLEQLNHIKTTNLFNIDTYNFYKINLSELSRDLNIEWRSCMNDYIIYEFSDEI
jgi:hypothetical protein